MSRITFKTRTHAFAFLSLAVAALLGASANAQTPTWSKANTKSVPVRFLNGTKGYIPFEDGELLRAYDMLNGKFLPMPMVKFNTTPWASREVSDDGKGFLLHNDGVTYGDFVLRMNGTTPLSFYLPYDRVDQYGMPMTQTTKMTYDGKYILQTWSNGTCEWYDAVDGDVLGSGLGTLVEVADGVALTFDDTDNLVRVDLATGQKTALPFAVPPFTMPLMGRNNLVVCKGMYNTNYYAINLLTGAKTDIPLEAGDIIVGAFSDGKTVAITNSPEQKAYVQRMGYPRQLVSTSISLSPDGTRGILAKDGMLRPIYNPGNDTSFNIEEVDYVPFRFDASHRAILNLDNRVLRTLSETGSIVSDKPLPALPKGSVVKFISPDTNTMVYQDGNQVRRYDLKTNADTFWYSAQGLAGWETVFEASGKIAVVHRENPNSDDREYLYFAANGDSYYRTLPYDTNILGFAPNGRLVTDEYVNGKAHVRYYDAIEGVMKKSIPAGSSKLRTNYAISGDGNTLAIQASDGYRLINYTTGVVKKIGGQAALKVDLNHQDTTVSLSYDGSLMSFGPMVFKTSNYASVLTAPLSAGGKGMFSKDNISFVYRSEQATSRYYLPVSP